MRIDPQSYALAANASATGAATAIRGGIYQFQAAGTVGGATISLQVQHADGTWCDVGGAAGATAIKTTALPFNASPVYLPAGNVRAAITGGAGVSLNASLVGIG